MPFDNYSAENQLSSAFQLKQAQTNKWCQKIQAGQSAIIILQSLQFKS